MSHENLALRLAALRVLIDFMQEQYVHARAEAARVMKRGERLVARSPIDDDLKIAVIPKSDPKPVVRLTDERALTDWMVEHYPDKVGSGYEIIGSTKEVVTVLFTHAPHLLRRTRVLNLEVVGEIKQMSATLGQPVGPGGEVNVPGLEVTIPDGVVTCRPTEHALAIIRDLHDQGVLELDGTVAPVREVTP